MKPAIKSQTIVASMISIVALGSQMIGYDVNLDLLNITLNDVIAVMGAAWAIWGRWKASTPIQGVLK